MKIVLKGILAHEDRGARGRRRHRRHHRVEPWCAQRAYPGRSTIDALPEIVEAVRGRMPILVDFGFRRGTDIVKALCLGANCGLHRAALYLGPRRLRPAGRRARAGAAARRALRRHAAGRRAYHPGIWRRTRSAAPRDRGNDNAVLIAYFHTDIHGNREAFEACLTHAQRHPIDRYVFLGDFVGYGADPGFVVDTVKDFAARGAARAAGQSRLGRDRHAGADER